jgi:hypothetical protein
MLRCFLTALALGLFVGVPSVQAKNRIVNDKFEELPPVPSVLRPTTPSLEGPAQAIPPIVYSVPVTGEQWPVDYRYKHPRHGKYSKCDTAPVTLLIKDPCTCCLVEVPICIPCCCVDVPPQICWSSGAFGRDVVTYSWGCGYDVRIAFRNKTNELIVTYSELQRR